MEPKSEKCVMIIDENLPLGIIANTAAIMGITLGKEMPEVVGANVTDQSGNEHLGIIEFPVPILKGSPEVCRCCDRLHCLLQQWKSRFKTGNLAILCPDFRLFRCTSFWL